ncbi:unnamed protein product [Agarophyton chilense]
MAGTYSNRSNNNEIPLIANRTIYPPIEPYHKDYLQVSKTHKIYYEVSGNRNGVPICFVHGGPGGGTVPAHRGFFDPRVYKIVLFDQRGCGKSQPFACLEDNTTWNLVDDMERVREAAGIDCWILFGGSWGSTLSIAYAQEHPHRVLGMILRGIFLSRKQELEWLYGPNGAAMLYPEAYDDFLTGLPKDMRDAEHIIDTFYSILSQEDNNEERRIAANAWSNWERSLSSFQRQDTLDDFDNDSSDDENLAFARLEAHYFVHSSFLTEDDYLLKESQMQKIRYIKTCIVQGRWDVVCPRKSAYDLARMFDPRCVEVVLVDNAGHSTFEPGIEEALLEATDSFGKEFGPGGIR